MIRFAADTDIPELHKLLSQVNLVHHIGRPDLFNIGTKYTNEELSEILKDKDRPILVYTDPEDKVLGYAFCIVQQILNDNIRTDVKTLYIDDLCVDKEIRSHGIGKALYEAVCAYAKENGFYNVTLNVWYCNQDALRFYQKLGLDIQKIGMEKIL
ncbi:MAG: GNAT family N-acetyltransferase [Erysipelotrichaceae bacterium]|nr:GNAT family N-acetyltransferase [Erysipelotrichaceae bacterium]